MGHQRVTRHFRGTRCRIIITPAKGHRLFLKRRQDITIKGCSCWYWWRGFKHGIKSTIIQAHKASVCQGGQWYMYNAICSKLQLFSKHWTFYILYIYIYIYIYITINKNKTITNLKFLYKFIGRIYNSYAAYVTVVLLNIFVETMTLFFPSRFFNE